MTIAVQTAIGDIGGKATTELSYSFAAMINTGQFQYGFNDDGIFLLNDGEKDDVSSYERSFTLATTDLDIDNIKRLRYIYIGANVDDSFTISVLGDSGDWRDYDYDPSKTGIQEIRKSIGKKGKARYWKVKITSTKRFSIDSIAGLFIIRPLGVRG